jgi:hypothetical protein
VDSTAFSVPRPGCGCTAADAHACYLIRRSDDGKQTMNLTGRCACDCHRGSGTQKTVATCPHCCAKWECQHCGRIIESESPT